MNSNETVRAWVDQLAACPDVPFGQKLEAHLSAGQLTRLCTCGCNSFDLDIPNDVRLEPLCPPGGSGMFFEIEFEADTGSEVACLFFADQRGYLTGIDVTSGSGNHAPMPNRVKLGRVLRVHMEARRAI